MAIIENPRKNFNFSIQIAPLPLNPFLAQKVSIPDTSIDVATHGDANFDVKTAARVKYSAIQIEKIQTTSGADNYFYDWLKSCQDDIIGGGLIPGAYKRIVTIFELAEDGSSILNTWVCSGCWPSQVSGNELDRMGSENTIESIELQVDNIEKL